MLTEAETRLLYTAKCKDLDIAPAEAQYLKFRTNIQQHCTRRQFAISN